MPSGMSHADLLRALMQWCPMITNDEDKEALLAGAAALEAQAQHAEARATPREGLLEAENARLRALLFQAKPKHYKGECGHCGIDELPESECPTLLFIATIDAALRAPAEAPPAATEQREAHETLVFDVENAFRDLVKAMRAPREGYDPMPWVATALAHCKHALDALEQQAKARAALAATAQEDTK
jgi:hypothetical protein